MFQGEVRREPIPERVFALCNMLAAEPGTLKEVREKMEPARMNENSGYFGSILTAAKELHLVSQDADTDILSYTGDEQVIRTMEHFRKYCQSVVYADQETMFYKLTVCFLDSDLEWLKYNSLTSEEIKDEIRKKTDIHPVKEEYLQGMRFWMSFLGFGVVHDKTPIIFLPNMYTALKDFIGMAEPELNREYPLSEFVKLIAPYAHVALHGAETTHTFHYAMSAAFRMMNDNKEIKLLRNADSKEVWQLYRQDDHALMMEVTHIIILKEVQSCVQKLQKDD